MGRRQTEPVARREPSRIRVVIAGVVLGFVWGTLMWLVTGLRGGTSVWLYIALTTAMIGAGVAAFFGAVGAARRGERVTPRIRLPFRRR